MSKKIHRRRFISDTALSVSGMILANNLPGIATFEQSSLPANNYMQEVRKYRKIDSNAHINPSNGDPSILLDFADRLEIEKLVISLPIESGFMSPIEFKEYNNKVLNAVKQYPDKLLGKLTLNPVYPEESLYEIDRCVSEGMIGLKVFTQVKINDPLFYPVIEKFIDLKMIIQMHGECQLGVGGYRMKYDINAPPNVSIPEDFVDIAKRYPEAMFQFAHVAGGGDWEYALKAFRGYPNIFVDLSGSNNEEGLVDLCIRYLGEDRFFFGTDSSYYQAVGKIMASETSESQKRKIFFENFNAILKRSGHNIE